MEDWKQLEKTARLFLTKSIPIPSSRLLRGAEPVNSMLEDFESYKVFMVIDHHNERTFGLAKRRDNQLEFWFVSNGEFYSPKTTYFKYYKNWIEYKDAFTPGEVEALRNLGRQQLIDKNKQIIDTIVKTEFDNTIEEISGRVYPSCDGTIVLTSLWTRIIKLEKMMTEIYNAPGMPGCLAAQKSFKSQQN